MLCCTRTVEFTHLAWDPATGTDTETTQTLHGCSWQAVQAARPSATGAAPANSVCCVVPLASGKPVAAPGDTMACDGERVTITAIYDNTHGPLPHWELEGQ